MHFVFFKIPTKHLRFFAKCILCIKSVKLLLSRGSKQRLITFEILCNNLLEYSHQTLTLIFFFKLQQSKLQTPLHHAHSLSNLKKCYSDCSSFIQFLQFFSLTSRLLSLSVSLSLSLSLFLLNLVDRAPPSSCVVVAPLHHVAC